MFCLGHGFGLGARRFWRPGRDGIHWVWSSRESSCTQYARVEAMQFGQGMTILTYLQICNRLHSVLPPSLGALRPCCFYRHRRYCLAAWNGREQPALAVSRENLLYLHCQPRAHLRFYILFLRQQTASLLWTDPHSHQRDQRLKPPTPASRHSAATKPPASRPTCDATSSHQHLHATHLAPRKSAFTSRSRTQ